MNHKQPGNHQKSQRGRPKNLQQVSIIHPQRQQKPQQIKQYWTEHRITLIAYEAQYIYNKKSFDQQPQPEKKQKKSQSLIDDKKQQEKQKKRKGRKKADPQFETGFLFSSNKQKQSSSNEQIKVDQLIKQYPNLVTLFNESNKDVDDIELRQFMKIMLELKNQDIVYEFLPIYDMIYKEITGVEFQSVEKEKDRTQFLKKIENKLHNLIVSSPEGNFKKFKEYLQNDLKQTLKLLYVEAYCFLAEKFNFNINQFYSQAFSITLQHNKGGTKKIKGE